MMKKVICLTLTLAMLLVGCKSTSTNQESKYAENVTYSNSLFQITLPRELAEISEVLTLDNQISVYYKEAKDAGFGGLAFFISAYETPEEWAGGPLEKVGELSNQDAKIYDIVRGYATEIQWDYNEPSMPEGYGKLYDAAESVIESMIGINDFTYIHGAGTKGEDLYNNVLSDYVKNITENNDPEITIDTVGYAYADTNVDGIDELFIGFITDGVLKGAAFDIYSMVEHRPAHVVSGDADNRFYNYEDAFVAKEWGDSSIYGLDIYNIESNTTDMLYQRGFKYDEKENPENPWLKSYDGIEYEPITEDEFTGEIEDIKSKYVSLDFTPLAENENAIAGANIPKLDN